jgi:hypothetical protein
MPKSPKNKVIKFPVTVNFDNCTSAVCNNMKELQDEILDAHSEQSFADSITDANDSEFGVNWSVEIVPL